MKHRIAIASRNSCLLGADPGDGQEGGSSDVMLSRDFFRRLVVSRPARPLLVDDGAAPPVGARADARRRVAGARVVVVMAMAVVDLADGSQLLAVVVLPPGLARSETHVDWCESGWWVMDSCSSRFSISLVVERKRTVA